ncbi:MAG: hypothetical protein KGJ06_01020 [Pseudomonadota bacterium]|nr:hypothetical protein [Pseudomonadota bacterium]
MQQTTFDDILSAICSTVRPQHADNHQRVYLIGDADEAKLALNVLTVYGFSANLYPDEDSLFKLYIQETEPDEAKLSAALAYAGLLRQIKASLDAFRAQGGDRVASACQMAFADTHDAKQILIKISSVKMAPAVAAPKPAAASAAPARSASPQKPRPQAARTAAAAGGLTAGPALAKKLYGKAKQNQEDDSLTRRAFLYFTGNMASAGFVFIMMLAGVIALFSLLVFAKGFLCPDFAQEKKNTAWYCSFNQ